MTTTKKQYVSNRPAISMKDLKKMFPYMSQEELENDMARNEWIKLDKFLEQERKKNDAYRERAEVPDLTKLTISIEWKKSRTWGHNPHARYSAHFADGTYMSGGSTCSGCGYDKASTVIADIFNEVCSGMLWRKRNTRKEVPYGIYAGKKVYFPKFGGGIGVNCYVAITNFLGGQWEHTDWSDTYDRYEITFPAKKARKTA